MVYDQQGNASFYIEIKHEELQSKRQTAWKLAYFPKLENMWHSIFDNCVYYKNYDNMTRIEQLKNGA